MLGVFGVCVMSETVGISSVAGMLACVYVLVRVVCVVCVVCVVSLVLFGRLCMSLVCAVCLDLCMRVFLVCLACWYVR